MLIPLRNYIYFCVHNKTPNSCECQQNVQAMFAGFKWKRLHCPQEKKKKK